VEDLEPMLASCLTVGDDILKATYLNPEEAPFLGQAVHPGRLDTQREPHKEVLERDALVRPHCKIDRAAGEGRLDAPPYGLYAIAPQNSREMRC
jgi:hypothetical protein